MGWIMECVLLLLLRYMAVAADLGRDTFQLDDDGHRNYNSIGEMDVLSALHQYEEIELERLERLLTNSLLQPWPKGVSPLVYVEENTTEKTSSNEEPQENKALEDDTLTTSPFKRSRYYRRYPWKRQNSRYDAENRYLCQPSKEDVFRLLVALHEARQGNRGQTINFCNRKRPASAVFTNIRFLG